MSKVEPQVATAPPAYPQTVVQPGNAPTIVQPGSVMAMGPIGYTTHYQPPTSTTTIVVAQPTAPTVSSAGREFSTGLCGCFDDMSVCLCAMCCPGCFLAKLADDMGEGCTITCCVPTPFIPMRAAWRNRHNIRGSIQNDCCVACWCYQCAMCQLAQDVKMVKMNGGH